MEAGDEATSNYTGDFYRRVNQLLYASVHLADSRALLGTVELVLDGETLDILYFYYADMVGTVRCGLRTLNKLSE